MRFSIRGPDSDGLLKRLTDGLEDAEFAIQGQVLADITVEGIPRPAPDGSVSVTIEALTIAE